MIFRSKKHDKPMVRTSIMIEKTVFEGLRLLGQDRKRNNSFIINEEMKKILTREGYIEEE